MSNKKPHFEVDRDGLARLLERRGKSFVVMELVQNAWDEPGVTHVEIELEGVPGRPLARLVVEDDAPEGFSDMAYAYTLFKASAKVDDPEQRGRFAIGEKLVLALVEEATISSTKGAVRFDREGREDFPRRRRDRGSRFEATIRLTRQEVEEALRTLQTLIVPAGIETVINGVPLPRRAPLRSFEATLATELADEEGRLRPSRRQTTVSVYEPQPGLSAQLYEMGLPVVETGDRWDVSVGQKVPVSLDRTNLITPGYLRDLRALVLNEMADQLSADDAAETWVDDAMEDEQVSDAAIAQALDLRFGKRRVVFDPSDMEANRIAASQGFTVINGRALSKRAWEHVRRAEAALPAGQVTPSPKPFHPEGAPLQMLEPERWSPEIRALVEYAKRVARQTIGKEIVVEIADDAGWPFRGAYGQRRLILNAGRLGRSWFAQGPSVEVNDLLIHELAHEHGEHLSAEYDRALSRIGAQLVAYALARPEEFSLTAAV
jgi:hypothetical protein